MANIGYGYGSEWHLLRYLGRHRCLLNQKIERKTGGKVIAWLDFPFNRRWNRCDPRDKPDAEWKGLDFLPNGSAARERYAEFWPQRGNVPNWDAVGRLRTDAGDEWLLVEAKAHVSEMKQATSAKERGGLPKIRCALAETRAAVGIRVNAEVWLSRYYQYCNRLATLHYLGKREVPARLIFIYFTGDRERKSCVCPKDESDWKQHINAMKERLGLRGSSVLETRVHEVFLPVWLETD